MEKHLANVAVNEVSAYSLLHNSSTSHHQHDRRDLEW
jgi:hypothetical protein